MLDIHIIRMISFNDEKELVYELDIDVRNVEHLEKAFVELKKLTYIVKVERVIR